jgi:murein DD-endopeptidase MepM/ murein hydrolase activator NlpD
MNNLWHKWRNRHDQREYWQTSSEIYSYGWLKKIVITILLFLAVYEIHIANNVLTPYIDNNVKYIVTAHIDFNNLAAQVKQYASSHNIDLMVINKVKTTLTKPADPLLYMQRPTNGKVLVPYGWRNDSALTREVMQEGIVFDATQSDSISAAAPGTVKIVSENIQYGKIVIIEHGRNIETLYGNLREVLVGQGEIVSQGQIIGKAIVKDKTTPTVYFEIRENGKAIDPLKRLRSEAAAEGK